MSDMVIQVDEKSEIQRTYISAEEYMQQYADKHYEWVDGEVFEMASVTDEHNSLTGYLYMLLLGYLEMNPIGLVRYDPFVMRLDATRSYRQPDLQVILGDNLKNLTPTAMIGAADICIEVVSPASVGTDYDTKYDEYERAGVQEYWIIDPKRHDARFHRLNPQGRYEIHHAETDYTTPLLPKFVLHIPTLWREKLPATLETADIVRAMFKD